MIILGIETSCDETAVAIIENGRKILSNIVASSIELHQKTGGIIPEIAAREQLKYIVPAIKEALEKSRLKPKDLDALAVTSGPGLIGSLLIGVETAKTLAYLWKKPIVPINHLQAHLYANFIREHPVSSSPLCGIPTECQCPVFPAIGLVVSGGHTDLILMKNHSQIKWLGGTRDDAAGECFDKCARLLNLGYPGGPAIAATAAKYIVHKTENKVKLPRPMINDDNFDFSFSGLKTALLSRIKELENKKVKINTYEIAYEIQEAVTDVLVKKVLKAVSQNQVNSLLLAGGVTANPRLKEKMKEALEKQQIKIPLFIPEPKFCTDNATFVASCAFFNFEPVPWQKIQADSSLEIEEVIKF
ncbi:MAG: tRNA (adenosine(37)-N6)-threonylcarbamoyltransferase complex transferase subunit TsaD [Candidatus Shapirobacteria bacterium]|nr:tRNA (adenosine(37)-N6)-threonylcarbamoyltransferase complex transferase subunit TsaD [Candidatus Shapirobacteria bacterium]